MRHRTPQAWELLLETPVLGPSASSPNAPNALRGPYASARVAWRGDGKFFATLCHEPLDQQQTDPQQQQESSPAGVNGAADGAGAGSGSVVGPVVVRVWDREGLELHAVGQAAGGLAAVAAWQPNGRHLYVAAQCDRWGSGRRLWICRPRGGRWGQPF